MNFGDPYQSTASISFKPSLSNLPFQVIMYYNALFSLVYATVIGSIEVDKYFHKVTDFASLIVVCIWFLIEPFRLYYGLRV